jgi:hypothetical protein
MTKSITGAMTSKVELTAKLLAPYLAVAVFWCGFSNAWLAILAYHVQILLWSCHERPRITRPRHSGILLLALPTALAGPLLYFLLPLMTQMELSEWLAHYHLPHWSLLIMVPYFGLLHPLLEQIHWAPLREETAWAHPLFAGYHILVLYALLGIPWLLLCFTVLTMASLFWQQVTKRSGSLMPAIASHVLADLGVIMTVV